MPVSYTKSGGQGHVYQVPDYPEAADGPKAFKDYSDFLDLILPPVGTVMPYVGASAPTGWLICDGGQYSSATYPKLSALCGTKFGTASAGNFRVPNLRGRSIVGYDSSVAAFDLIGKTGGSNTVSLTVSNMPSHSHNNPDHSHAVSGTVTIGGATGGTGHEHSVSLTASGTTGNANTSHQHDSRSRVVNTFVKTGGGSGLVRESTGDGDTGLAGASHTHTFSTSVSGTTGSAGGNDGHTHTGTVAITVDGGGATTSSVSGSGTGFSIQNPYMALTHIIRAA